jgi:hypothetical protein
VEVDDRVCEVGVKTHPRLWFGWPPPLPVPHGGIPKLREPHKYDCPAQLALISRPFSRNRLAHFDSNLGVKLRMPSLTKDAKPHSPSQTQNPEWKRPPYPPYPAEVQQLS